MTNCAHYQQTYDRNIQEKINATSRKKEIMSSQEEHNLDVVSCTACRNSARIADNQNELKDSE